MALTAKKVYAILKRQISDMEAKLNSPVRYRGTVATADLLPLNPDIGDMYNIESKSVYGEAGMNVAWNGVVWDTMGAPIDMSLYIKSSELADWVKQQNKPTYTAEEVGALPADTKIPSKTSDLQNDSGFLTKIPDNYLSGTDKTLNVSGKAADAKATGDKITELSADISNKLNKNQGSENSGKIAGINESGDIVPMFPVSVDYNEETNCLEFGSDQKMELNKGINLDNTLTKTGYAADAGVTGKKIDSLKEDISNKITKFYASNQGETHLADSDNGKIMDMVLYGRSEQKQYSGKNLLNYDAWKDTLIVRGTAIYENNGITLAATRNDCYTEMDLGTGFPDNAKIEVSEGETLTLSWEEIENKSGYIYIFGNGIASNGIYVNNRGSKKLSYTVPSGITFITFRFGVDTAGDTISYKNIQIEKGSESTTYEPYTGGIPSPNPDYPQEIKSVVNPTVKVCGKNLYPDGDLIELTKSYTTDFIPVVFNRNTIYLAFECNTNTVDGKYYINMIYYDKNKQKLGSNGSASQIGEKITKIEDSSSFNGIGAGNGGTNVDLKKVSYVKIVFNIYDNTATKITYKNIVVSSTPTAYEPYHEQTVTLPYTLNAIPVSSGGNVTINGQQYIADYVDVERGKVVKRVKVLNISNLDKSKWGFRTDTSGVIWHSTRYYGTSSMLDFDTNINAMSNIAIYGGIGHDAQGTFRLVDAKTYLYQFNLDKTKFDKVQDFTDYLASNNVYIQYALKVPQELDLKPEEIVLFKSLSANYPTTNISINSEQLDGYTVFNYPISMQNGWNYVKQQIGDTREYIYDMDARAQDTDLQAAEAYVNSEYAVALTELEV